MTGTFASNGRQPNTVTSIDVVHKNGKRASGRARKSWSDKLTEDLQNVATTWTDFGEIADDRPLLRNCVAQCVTTCG